MLVVEALLLFGGRSDVGSPCFETPRRLGTTIDGLSGTVPSSRGRELYAIRCDGGYMLVE